MAKEINCSLKLSIASKGGSNAVGSVTSSEDLSGGFEGFQATVGSTTAASLGLDVPSPKTVYIQNLDDTNFVTVDAVAGLTGWPQKLLPGTGVVLRPPNGTIYAKADSAPVNIWIVAG